MRERTECLRQGWINFLNGAMQVRGGGDGGLKRELRSPRSIEYPIIVYHSSRPGNIGYWYFSFRVELRGSFQATLNLLTSRLVWYPTKMVGLAGSTYDIYRQRQSADFFGSFMRLPSVPTNPGWCSSPKLTQSRGARVRPVLCAIGMPEPGIREGRAQSLLSFARLAGLPCSGPRYVEHPDRGRNRARSDLCFGVTQPDLWC